MKVNGKEIDLRSDMTLKDFLISEGYDISRVAVELNGTVSPRRTYGDVVLKDNDSMEIVSFVGGG